MDAYTNFPDFCCICLRPDPRGTWRVKNSSMEHVGDNRYLTKWAQVDVPLCGGCRLGIWGRLALVLLCSLAAAGGVFGWWYLDTRGETKYLLIGAGLAVVAGFVSFLVFLWLFDADAPKRIAYLRADGSDIEFANPEYQKLYTGESKPGRTNEVNWREANWR
jgi:hypothetical protein